MHGVPTDLPVKDIVGSELTHIGLAMYQIQFHFDEGTLFSRYGTHLSVAGAWRLDDHNGKLVDEQVDPPSERKTYQIHRLLLKRVTAASIDAPSSLSVTFENGDVLTVFDDSRYYESFTLRIHDRFFVV